MVVASVALAGCSSGTLLSDVSRAIIKEQFGAGDDAIASSTLNPSFHYLRVNVPGVSPALLVLGYVDHDAQGDIEVWYSAKHEVIKTQNGRIVGTSGLEVDWQSVRFTTAPPTWDGLRQASYTFTRVRDEMPGYRYDLADQLTSSRVDGVPSIVLPTSLPSDVAKSYEWVRESSSSAQPGLPDSWYALEKVDGKYRVAYSYQCLSKQLCLNLQRWPIQKAAL
ncbi:YjbF family lipoprotein [Rhodoferax sp.]|uniref:YjbF family lipoprotein n=1 Tax=Rhodoferax sp. TaxID=50421 RepID=UPI0028529B82|nr:YjbF family lipoprotein [Rhodoferax sp.]